MIDVRQRLNLPSGMSRTYYSLPMLEKTGIARLSRLPVTIRILLESVLRHIDGLRIRNEDVEALAGWRPDAPRTAEVPFVVGRVLLQDFTGVPLLVDLAAMRSAVASRGKDLKRVQPRVPVDLVIDHSVQVDHFGGADALRLNMDMEFRRNEARYRFLKWGAQAFHGLRIVPPGFGICHQVNLEFLASVVLEKDGVLYPDTLVGTDSHTTMINGLGVLGWGVGGIEAEAAMLGQPVYLLLPDVVGVHLHGQLREGVTATDLVLRITELLRQAGVVGKLVEFHGDGAASLSVPDRATLGNMAPEYGATVGLLSGRRADLPLSARHRPQQRARRDRAPLLSGPGAVRDAGPRSVRLHERPRPGPRQRRALGRRSQAPAGPHPARRAQAAVPRAARVSRRLREAAGGSGPRRFGAVRRRHAAAARWRRSVRRRDSPTGSATNTSALTESEMMNNRPTPNRTGEVGSAPERIGVVEVGHGEVVIAAITSCTNTSNPAVMLAAGCWPRRPSSAGCA